MPALNRGITDPQKRIENMLKMIGVLMGVYHFLSARFMLTSAYRHIMIHYACCFVILFLTKINFHTESKKEKAVSILSVICIAAIILDTAFIYAHHDQYLQAMGNYTTGQIISGAIYLLVFLIGTYLAWGKVIPIIVAIFLLYGYFGPKLPGFLYHGGLSVKRLITYSTTNFTGVFGMMGQITACFLFSAACWIPSERWNAS